MVPDLLQFPKRKLISINEEAESKNSKMVTKFCLTRCNGAIRIYFNGNFLTFSKRIKRVNL